MRTKTSFSFVFDDKQENMIWLICLYLPFIRLVRLLQCLQCVSLCFYNRHDEDRIQYPTSLNMNPIIDKHHHHHHPNNFKCLTLWVKVVSSDCFVYTVQFMKGVEVGLVKGFEIETNGVLIRQKFVYPFSRDWWSVCFIYCQPLPLICLSIKP